MRTGNYQVSRTAASLMAVLFLFVSTTSYSIDLRNGHKVIMLNLWKNLSKLPSDEETDLPAGALEDEQEERLKESRDEVPGTCLEAQLMAQEFSTTHIALIVTTSGEKYTHRDIPAYLYNCQLLI